MSNNYANVKTTRPSKTGLNRQVYLLDATKAPIGRLATHAARLLMGKNRADWSPDTDMGGVVVVINAGQGYMTGKKMERKVYFRYGRQLGSLKSRNFEEAMAHDFKFPIYNAIKKMLPRNRHQDLHVNNRLHIYNDAEHGMPNQMIEIDPTLDNPYAILGSMVLNHPKVSVSKGDKVAAKPAKAPKAEVSSETAKFAATDEAPKAETSTSNSVSDDLSKIEGIGPKAAEEFIKAGITTFAQLANTDTDKMKEILANAESKVQHLDPTTWAEQSQLAADGKWEELKTLQDELMGGVEK